MQSIENNENNANEGAQLGDDSSPSQNSHSGEESLPSILKEALRGVGIEVPATNPSQSAPGDQLSPEFERQLLSVFPLISPDCYRLEGEFARGGLGRIMRAYDKRLMRQVAIKELLNASGHARERFLREAFVTAKLQHPSIVPIHEAGRWPTGDLFYSMKLVSGRSLKAAIDERASFAARLSLLPHIIAVCEAMAYAHSQRIIHRDLKPQNILVGDFGETVVIDWGLAKEFGVAEQEQNLTSAGAVLGTPAYMPPEQARGGVVDARADVYSLGAILYHVLVGASPYQGKHAEDILQKVTSGPPVHPALREPLLPKPLAEIVRKAMEREPERRYQSASELATALREFQSVQAAPATSAYRNVSLALGLALVAVLVWLLAT